MSETYTRYAVTGTHLFADVSMVTAFVQRLVTNDEELTFPEYHVVFNDSPFSGEVMCQFFPTEKTFELMSELESRGYDKV